MTRLASLLLLLFLTATLHSQTTTCGSKIRGNDQQRYEKALAAYNSKDYDLCSQIITPIAKRQPRNADVQFLAGLASVKRNNDAGIRRYFEKVISICPDYPDARAHLYHGIIRYSDNDFEGAVECLQRFFDSVNHDSRPEYVALYSEASNYLHWSQFLADAELNRAPFEPRLLLGASSPHEEIIPYITADGQSIYYVRYLPVDDRTTYYAREIQAVTPQLCVSHWKDTTFSEGLPLPEPFNSHESEGALTLTADNSTMYLTVMQRQRGYANYDIYTTHLDSGRWSALEPLPATINGERSWEAQPSVTPDGQYLYFASNRSGGQGGIDIWRCRRMANGTWGRAENLGPRVNTPGDEKCPFIHADGHTLYFASNGWQGFGGYDTYFINLDDPTQGIPTNLGLPINGESDDICFGVTTAGDRAYYAGKHPVQGLGHRDIIIFDLYPAARPEAMSVTPINVAGSNGKAVSATITVQRVGCANAIYHTDSLHGGTTIALAQRATNVVAITAHNHVPWVAVGNMRSLHLPNKVTLKPLSVGQRQPLAIELHSNTLLPDQKNLIDVYVQHLLQHPLVNIAIEAPHESQAKIIYDYMVSQKLRPSRLTYSGGASTIQIAITKQ